jgi:prophage antirepressor-like protein
MENNISIYVFENRDVRIVDRNGNLWFVAKDVCDVLGYENARDAVAKHCKDDVANRYALNLLDRNGRPHETTIISELNLNRLIMRSKKPEAEKFQDWVCGEVLPAIRRTGQYNLHNQRIGSLETEIQKLQRELDKVQTEHQVDRKKLQLFEEYNDDILYDFDQVASAIRVYRQPPFGVKHLKKWLSDHRIICLPFHKNDKPNQRYIERDWFRMVMHEYKRKGSLRYEARYMITQRGFNNMIDLAIREKIIEIPAPKQNYLPHIYEKIPPEAGGPITVDPVGDGREVKIY